MESRNLKALTLNPWPIEPKQSIPKALESDDIVGRGSAISQRLRQAKHSTFAADSKIKQKPLQR